VTLGVAKRYARLAFLFARWCMAMGFPVACEYMQLCTWCWLYCTRFSARSLGTHFSAFRWWCDFTGRDFPADGSLCMRKLARVRRALALSDPTVVRRCYPLVNRWLERMQRVDRLVTPVDLERCRLETLAFWVRVRLAHFAMMRGCAHASGMRRDDVEGFVVVDAAGARVVGGDLYELRVGHLEEGLLPRDASNRKLKLRAARRPVIPVWDDVSSAGLLLRVFLRRWHARTPPGGVLLADFSGDVPVQPPAPMSGYCFLSRLRRLARKAGMPPAEVACIEQRSLRAGGCTDFFAMGISREEIMRQGGWTSETVDIYNRPDLFYRWASFAYAGPLPAASRRQ